MPYELRALSRHFYRGGSAICALDRVTLRVDAGEYVAVVGPSGCGKTTLLHILGAIDPEYSGQLRLDDQDLATLNATERAALRLAKMGLVFQTHFCPLNAPIPTPYPGHSYLLSSLL